MQRPLARLARPLHCVCARRGGDSAVQARRRRRRRGRLVCSHARWRPRHLWPRSAQGGAQARAVLVGRSAAEQRDGAGGAGGGDAAELGLGGRRRSSWLRSARVTLLSFFCRNVSCEFRTTPPSLENLGGAPRACAKSKTSGLLWLKRSADYPLCQTPSGDSPLVSVIYRYPL